MSRTAGHFYSREAAYSLQRHMQATPESPATPDRILSTNDSSMTWQQQEAFGATKRRTRKVKGKTWTPLDHESTQDSQSIPHRSDNSDVCSSSASAQPITRPIEGTPNPGTRHGNNVFNSQQISHSNQGHHQARSPTTQTREGKMALPKSAFIPPHLRKSIVPDSPAVKIEDSKTQVNVAAESAAIDHVHKAPDQGLTLPPSPPTTVDEPRQAMADPAITTREDGSFATWDDPKPQLTPKFQRRENTQWPRGARKWPKASEMRAPTEASNDDGGVKCRSDSEGDENYDIKKLIDFNGDWITPDPDWAARRSYQDRHFGRTIEQWMNGQPSELLKAMQFHVGEFTNSTSEVVPHYWTLPMVEGKSLGEFWKDMPGASPAALSDVDIHAEAPYWERYDATAGCLLPVFDVPTARIDPTDFDNRHANPLALASAKERMLARTGKVAHRHHQKQVKQARPIRAPMRVEPKSITNEIVPTLNFYIRPVQPTDVVGIAEIYNYYVEHTICAHEFEPHTEASMRSHVDNITSQGLPFLVAVAKGNHGKKKTAQHYATERIIGFASLDDICDSRSMYRYTFDMDLYVNPGFTKNEIGKCLLDKILHIVNTGYHARGGYEYTNDFDYLNTGARRTIKTINITLYKENGEDDKGSAAWLKPFNFHRAGHFQKVGFKLGKVVDSFTYQHHTSEEIDPAS